MVIPPSLSPNFARARRPRTSRGVYHRALCADIIIQLEGPRDPYFMQPGGAHDRRDDLRRDRAAAVVLHPARRLQRRALPLEIPHALLLLPGNESGAGDG